MAKIKHATANAEGHLGKGKALVHCWWNCKLIQLLWKSVWRSLKELRINLAHDPDIPLFGACPKNVTSDFTGIHAAKPIAALVTKPKK